MTRRAATLLTMTTLSCTAALYAGGRDAARGGGAAPSVYSAWKHGPSPDPGYFPIGVWLQDPRRAPQFQKAGINLYVALWKGPTEEQLSMLKAAGMRVVCDQNAVGLKHL